MATRNWFILEKREFSMIFKIAKCCLNTATCFVAMRRCQFACIISVILLFTKFILMCAFFLFFLDFIHYGYDCDSHLNFIYDSHLCEVKKLSIYLCLFIWCDECFFNEIKKHDFKLITRDTHFCWHNYGTVSFNRFVVLFVYVYIL